MVGSRRLILVILLSLAFTSPTFALQKHPLKEIIPDSTNDSNLTLGGYSIVNVGSVGIGTSNPIKKLDIRGASDGLLILVPSDDVNPSNDIFQITNSVLSNKFSVRKDGTTIVQGSLGVGTSNPGAAKLKVTGGQVSVDTGSISAPSIISNAAPNTGIVFGSSSLPNNIYFVSNGGNSGGSQLSVQPNTIVSTVPIWINLALGSNGGSASQPVYSFGVDQDTGIFSEGQNELGIATGGVSRLYVKESNIGIGTSSPSQKLHVAGNVRIEGLSNCNTIDTDANGNLVCGTDAVNAGTVTSVGSGTGLTGGSITSSGSISLNTAGISSCTGSGQKIFWDSTNNRLTCGTDVDTDTRCSTLGTCSQVCIGSDCRNSWPASSTSGQITQMKVESRSHTPSPTGNAIPDTVVYTFTPGSSNHYQLISYYVEANTGTGSTGRSVDGKVRFTFNDGSTVTDTSSAGGISGSMRKQATLIGRSIWTYSGGSSSYSEQSTIFDGKTGLRITKVEFIYSASSGVEGPGTARYGFHALEVKD
jgi:hypothetical protein